MIALGFSAFLGGPVCMRFRHVDVAERRTRGSYVWGSLPLSFGCAHPCRRARNRPEKTGRRRSPGTWRRSFSRGASAATAATRSGRSCWRRTSRLASARWISPRWPRTGRCPPGSPRPGSGPSSSTTARCRRARSPCSRRGLDADAPRGEPEHMPSPARFADGWALGEPDLVLEIAEDFNVPASGPDIYRCFVIPTNLPRDVLVSAVECRPGNRRVVHHMIAYLDTHGYGRERDAAEAGPGYTSFSGPGVEIDGRPGRLGGRQRGHPPPRWDRPRPCPVAPT